METRLFWIGLVMGGYAWITRRWTRSGRLDTRAGTASWHALFFALAGFALTLVGVLWLESRGRFSSAVPGMLTPRELWAGLTGALLLGSWGFWRAWSRGTESEKRRHFLTEDLEWAETVFSAVLLAALLMYFVVQAFKIPSGSMEATLKIGDHLFVNKFIYGVRIPFMDKRVLPLRKVRRGDIIVFRFPTDDDEEVHCGSIQYGKDFIKRVIGLPGDVVEIEKGMVRINGESLGREPYTQFTDPGRQSPPVTALSPAQYEQRWIERELDKELGDTMRDNFGPVTVPEGSYFVMGDNRDRSCDGRFWGAVPQRYLKGKAWIIYFPPSRMGSIS
ncbi:MAG: signal peptidase I [Elusimicrobiota bacterium]